MFMYIVYIFLLASLTAGQSRVPQLLNVRSVHTVYNHLSALHFHDMGQRDFGQENLHHDPPIKTLPDALLVLALVLLVRTTAIEKKKKSVVMSSCIRIGPTPWRRAIRTLPLENETMTEDTTSTSSMKKAPLRSLSKSFDNDVNKKQQEPLTSPMMQLAKNRQFDKIESILRCKDTDVENFLAFTANGGMMLSGTVGGSDSVDLHQGSLTTEESSNSRDSGHPLTRRQDNPTTPLHEVLEYCPPLAVVNLLCQSLHFEERTVYEFSISAGCTNSSPEDVATEDGRKPLHIACEHGCDIAVVKRLMKGTSYVRPVMACDVQGRTPLHWACENPKGTSTGSSFSLFNSSRRKQCVDNMVQVIESLLHAYPRAALLKDQNHQTPLDIARDKKADARILKLLESAIEKVQAGTRRYKLEGRNVGRNTSYATTPDSSVVTTTNHMRRVLLNDTPIDLDQEMEKLYTLESSSAGRSHVSDCDSPLDLVIDWSPDTDECCTEEEDDDSSSLGSNGISKHDRKFEPFANVTDLIDI